MCKTQSFKSLLAKSPYNDWLETEEIGQFEHDNNKYIVGNMVENQRLVGCKKINLSTEDEQFEAMLIGTIVNANISGDINLVCGFPHSTLKSNIEGLKRIKDKTYSFKTPINSDTSFCIRNILPVYESVGHAIGVKYSYNINKRMFAVSIGFGTVEGVLLLDDGTPVHANIFSERIGTYRAARILKEILVNEGIRVPLEGGSDLWYDDLIVRAYNLDKNLMVKTNTRMINVEELRKYAIEALNIYAKNILVPKLDVILDEYKGEKMPVAICGGGALYSNVKEYVTTLLKKHGFEIIQITDDFMMKSAAVGYAAIAKSKEEKYAKRTLAVDFGNCNTVYSFLE